MPDAGGLQPELSKSHPLQRQDTGALPGKWLQGAAVPGRWGQLGLGWQGNVGMREALDKVEIKKEVLPGLPDLGGFSQTWYLTPRKTWPLPERVGSLIGECRAQAVAEPSSNWVPVPGGAACGRRTQETSSLPCCPAAGEDPSEVAFPGKVASTASQGHRDHVHPAARPRVPECPCVHTGEAAPPGPLTWRKVWCCRVLAACRTDVPCSISCSRASR